MRMRETRKTGMRKTLTYVSVAVIAAGLVLGLVALGRGKKGDLPGRFVPEMSSRRHIPADERHEPYNSSPPTSGPHYAEPTKAGAYSEQAADEIMVHNMEHGHVIIWYKCGDQKPFDQECENEREELRKLAEDEFDSWKVALMPRVELETRYALTAWERIDTFHDFDIERVRRFIKAYRDKGPERTME
jgi:hypothetical protein